MARRSQAEAEQGVLDAIAKAPNGTISHSALVAALQAAGNGDDAKWILVLQQNKRINGLVYRVPGAKPELRYSVGGA